MHLILNAILEAAVYTIWLHFSLSQYWRQTTHRLPLDYNWFKNLSLYFKYTERHRISKNSNYL